MRKVVVVEDLVEVRDWLVRCVTACWPRASVQEAGSLAQARRVIQADTQLVLLDLGLPDGDGIALIRALAGAAERPQIVVTTIFDDDEHLFEALRQGADGYLLKDETDERMVHLLRQFAEGQPPLSASIARRILGSFHAPAGSEGLTPREQDVLVLAAKGYSARQISDMLGLSPHTTAGYLKGVYRKLQVNSRAEATLAAIRLGLVAPGNA